MLHPADIAKHVRVDVQAEVRDVVNVFGGDQPDDLADFPFRKMARQVGKCVRVDFFLLRQLRYVVQRDTFGFLKWLLVRCRSSASNLA